MEHLNPTFPKARQTGILIEQVGEDTIVYDEERKEAHSLNRPASIVWSHSDGTRSVEDLAAVLGSELGAAAPESVAQYAVDELSRAHLLDEATDNSEPVSRRDVIKQLSLAGAAFVLPAVLTVAAPTPAMALSGGQNDQGQNQNGQGQNGQ